jgi:hypothetical protein
MASTRGIPKNEAIIVMNVGGNGMAQVCPLNCLSIPSMLFLEEEVETQLRGNSNRTSPLNNGGRY